jgi:hypothetical protein
MITKEPEGIYLGLKVGHGAIGIMVLVKTEHFEGLREVLDGSYVEFGDSYTMMLADGKLELAGEGIALRTSVDLDELKRVLEEECNRLTNV